MSATRAAPALTGAGEARSGSAGASARPLLEVRDLRTEFVTEDGVVHAVNGVSFHIDAGETLAIVGESGSGKSVTMLSVMGLIPYPPGRIASGEILFEGVDLVRLDGESMRRMRGRSLAMIFQEPLTSLDPVYPVGDQIVEALRAHLPLGRREATERATELLRMVNIPEPKRVMDDYPHQLSGGMCQRVMLAIALSCGPKLLIADEPTTALDITTQLQLLDLIRRLQEELHMAVVWITHDMGIVAGLADRVMVMYGGLIMEQAGIDELYGDPLHPYTLGLLACIPRLDEERSERLASIPGTPPDLLRPPPACPFAPRCSFRLDRCVEEMPPLAAAAAGHERACWAPLEAVRTAQPS